jgi:hypothetical protein
MKDSKRAVKLPYLYLPNPLYDFFAGFNKSMILKSRLNEELSPFFECSSVTAILKYRVKKELDAPSPIKK